jgi:hypothetical protein
MKKPPTTSVALNRKPLFPKRRPKKEAKHMGPPSPNPAGCRFSPGNTVGMGRSGTLAAPPEEGWSLGASPLSWLVQPTRDFSWSRSHTTIPQRRPRIQHRSPRPALVGKIPKGGHIWQRWVPEHPQRPSPTATLPPTRPRRAGRTRGCH